jgi:hypothetical protein
VSVVVRLGARRSKGTLTVLRELLILAAKGKIVGLRFHALMQDGTERSGATGGFDGPAPREDQDETTARVYCLRSGACGR